MRTCFFSVRIHLKAENCPILIKFLICWIYIFIARDWKWASSENFEFFKLWVKNSKRTKKWKKCILYTDCHWKVELDSNYLESQALSKNMSMTTFFHKQKRALTLIECTRTLSYSFISRRMNMGKKNTLKVLLFIAKIHVNKFLFFNIYRYFLAV